MSVSHEDINRAVGRVEGNQDGFRERMDRFEETIHVGFEKVGSALEKIDARLKRIEASEQERKGAWRVVLAISGIVSACVAAAYKYLTS